MYRYIMEQPSHTHVYVQVYNGATQSHIYMYRYIMEPHSQTHIYVQVYNGATQSHTYMCTGI